MALLDLFWNLTENQLARGITDPAEFQLPLLVQENSPVLSVQLLKRSSYFWGEAPFARIPVSGYALNVSVGSANNPLAAQATWTTSADGYSLEAALPLNTSGINALTGDPSEQRFEMRLSDGTNFYSLSKTILIRKAVTLASSMVPVAGDTALGKAEAALRYVPKQGLIELVMNDASTGVPHLIRIVDGVLLADPIS